jgi:predicted metal-dependent phosphoesterase TrpH
MRIDLHVHTWLSEDSMNPPWLIMKVARRRGLDGVAATDHNTIRAWPAMAEAAKKYGMLFVRGEEIRVTLDGRKCGEILGLFMNQHVRPGDVMEVLDSIREQDGIVSVSHPFDSTKGFKGLELVLRKVDAIEGFNARLISGKANQRAYFFAREKGLGVTGGSDAHIPLEVGMGYTEAECSSLEEFRKALKKRQTCCGGSMVPLVLNLPGKGLMSIKKVACRI